MIQSLRPFIKFYARFLVLLLLFQILTPNIGYALTDGPRSPEFSKFEPVATTDMVNHFTGDFSYNIPALFVPGPDGGGYSLSLSYQSGTSAEQEASWVGYGWTLNPGAINRDTRGIPDDYKDVDIIRYNKTYPNWTASASANLGDLEIYGFDVQASVGTALRINGAQGIQRSISFGLSYQGLVNLGTSITPQGNTFSANINPIKYLQKLQQQREAEQNKDVVKSDVKTLTDFKNHFVAKSIQMTKQKWIENPGKSLTGGMSTIGTSSFGIYSFSEAVQNSTFSKYIGRGYNRSGGLQVNPAIFPVGGQIGFNSSFNYQLNVPSVNYKANGYMNNLTVNDYPKKSEIEGKEAEKNAISDYYIERNDPYQKRDYVLGIPFSSPDNFLVASEGIGGGFRYHQSKAGHFYPSLGNSKTTSDDKGLEFMLGLDIGIGLDIGFGGQAFYSSQWSSSGNTDNYQFDNKGGFRFNHDLGGAVNQARNTNTPSAKLIRDENLGLNLEVSDEILSSPIEDKETLRGQSSQIQHHTLDDIRKGKRFDPQSPALNKLISEYNQGSSKLKNLNTICEFNAVKEDGANYTFGIPVFAANEVALQINVDPMTKGACPPGKYSDCILDKQLVYQELNYNVFPDMDLSKHDLVVGDIKKEPYANLFLLTQITDKDYIDRTLPGPDKSDFGGWTKFHYQNSYDLHDPYRWRTPYTGLLYSQNEISDSKDDVASIYTGDKEVYYLKAIETKSHIAFFVTNQSKPEDYKDILPEGFSANFLNNNLAPRMDGYDANSTFSSKDPNAKNANQKGDKTLVYLDRIILFSKANPNKPISTTRFAYDYSLIKDLPNNKLSNFPNNKGKDYLQSGKLTLTKVWFEYEGVNPTRISPYQFHYEYPKSGAFSNHLTQKYPWLVKINKDYSSQDQNPDYNPFLLDAWGFYHPDGKARKAKSIPWLNQNLTTYAHFDPAAWQLKRIQLPYGGEILVEYESKNYQFVQNRRAMGMAKLKSFNMKDNRYVIDVSDLGLDPTNQQQVVHLKEVCEQYFLQGKNGKEKIYFKYLFGFKGQNPALDNCDSEYITGYADVVGFSVQPIDGRYYLSVQLNDNDDITPRKGCYDFYTTQRLGFEEAKVATSSGNEACDCLLSVPELSISGSFQPSFFNTNELTQAILNSPNPDQHSDRLLNAIEAQILSGRYGIPGFESVCSTINPELSYLKLPMVTPKRGGGIRVKRLLLYDPGIESNDETIYGSEYRYVLEDGSCSGVATTEPSVMKEENALVTFMPRKDQGWYNRLTVGADKKQTEGPIGETLLPSPSIGHARVEVHNIHQGRTGGGFQVFEFFTVKDYPFDKYYNQDQNNDIAAGKAVDFTQISDNSVESNINIPAGLFNYSTSSFTAAQGFRFILNNMHGQPKGEYTFGQNGSDHTYLSSSKKYKYYEPGEKVNLRLSTGKFIKTNPGKEMEIVMEMQSLYNNSMNFTVEVDVSIGIAIPPPIAITAVPSISISENTFNTHLTSKVVRYPAILKSMESFVDGTSQVTDYVAFDQYTGQPILTRTTDEFDQVTIGQEKWDGSIYTYKIPAAHIYSAMGPKYLNDVNTNQLNEIAATYSTYGKNGNPIKNNQEALNDVLAASISTFAANRLEWFNPPEVLENYGIGASDLTKLTKVWRPYQTYVFKSDRTEYNQQTPAFKAGIIKNFIPFNWTNEQINLQNGWLKLNTITKYAPHGQVLEEMDVLGRFYAMKYNNNYNHIVPAMRAANAKYSNIAFQDFEYSSQGTSSDQVNQAHSGQFGFRINANERVTVIPALPFGTLIYTEQIQKSKGAWIKVWVKNSNQEPNMWVRINNARQSSTPMEKVASTGEWSLYRALLTPHKFENIARLSTGSRITIQIATRNDIIVDDLRFQPYDAQASCYVYDNETFRLIAQFDDQHFGLYYKYNDEGKLILKQIETERGMKTIQETQYHTPKIKKSE